MDEPSSKQFVKILICLMVVVTGCAQVEPRPAPRATATLSVKGFAAPPNTMLTWFFGVFGCGIYRAGYGQTRLPADGTFTVAWEPRSDRLRPSQFYAFVDANQNGRCDADSEPVLMTNVLDGVADFAAAQPVSYGCRVMELAKEP